MSQAILPLGGFSLTAAAPTKKTYEVSLIKKIIRYQPLTGRMFAIEHEWVYTTIVTSEAIGFAVYEALYEYFVWQISRRRRQLGMRRLRGRELTMIDLFARDQAESALRRTDTPDQIIYIAAHPWEPELITVHFGS